ncbi:MAG: ParB/RepB/Spo0J family partition protein [Albidovulum sp.]|nr:ParB/RepB/Spo0J family partition protein [Albidovulum sp.]
MASRKNSLGRGLSTLIGDLDFGPEHDYVSGKHETREGFQLVPIELLAPNPDQPRREFSNESLTELARSLKETGIIQPLIARPAETGQGSFQIVAGERRWRAAQIAQIHEVPVIVRKFSDSEALQVALVENLQRAELNPLDEARAYRTLIDKFGHTQEILSKSLGKSRSQIANVLRLLTLPDQVQRQLEEGKLTIGHARAIIPAKDPATLSEKIIQKGLSVRQAEKLARKSASGSGTKREPQANRTDADTKAVERELSLCLGTKVSVRSFKDAKRGKLEISYRSLEQLDRICKVIVAGHLSQAS